MNLLHTESQLVLDRIVRGRDELSALGQRLLCEARQSTQMVLQQVDRVAHAQQTRSAPDARAVLHHLDLGAVTVLAFAALGCCAALHLAGFHVAACAVAADDVAAGAAVDGRDLARGSRDELGYLASIAAAEIADVVRLALLVLRAELRRQCGHSEQRQAVSGRCRQRRLCSDAARDRHRNQHGRRKLIQLRVD